MHKKREEEISFTQLHYLHQFSFIYAFLDISGSARNV